MSTLTIPNLFAPNTVALSAAENANFAAISTWANGNVDNTNVGAAGFYASQLVPTSGAQATFGGGTVGYKFANSTTSVVGLTIAAPSGQSVDILDVTLNGVVKASFDSTGKFVTALAATLKGGATFQDASDATKQAAFAMSTITASTTRTFTFPDVSGTFITSGDTGTVTNAMIAAGAGISQSKLAAFAGVAVGGALTTATTGSFSGAVTFSQTSPNLQILGSGTPTAGTLRYANDGSVALSPSSTGVLALGFDNASMAAIDFGPTNGWATMTSVLFTVKVPLTSTGLGTFAGVAVGGALTTATTGSFSGAVSMGALTATTGAFAGAVSGITTLAIGGALTGATTVNASGLGTFVGLTAGTGTVQGSSNGSTVAYNPPVYNLSGAALASTTHMVAASIAGPIVPAAATYTVGQVITTGTGTYSGASVGSVAMFVAVNVTAAKAAAVAVATATGTGSFTWTVYAIASQTYNGTTDSIGVQAIAVGS